MRLRKMNHVWNFCKEQKITCAVPHGPCDHGFEYKNLDLK